MRRLVLLRHAKSSWDDPTLRDEDRPLAPRGERAADAIAMAIAQDELRPELVLCSSALRTRQTLARVLQALGPALAIQIDPALYTFESSELQDRVRAVAPEVQTLMLVGHNPAMEILVSALAVDGEELLGFRKSFPTAGLAVLELKIEDWSQTQDRCGTLVSFVTPRSLKERRATEPDRG